MAPPSQQNPRKKSPVWDHFRVSENDECKAICIHCEKHVSRGTSRRRFNTTNLARHMQTCFRFPRRRPSRADEGDEPTASSTASATASATTSATTSRQTSLTSFVSIDSAYPHNHPRQNEISRLIGLMMALDFRPFSIVENAGFRRLLQYMDPRYKIPTRPVFSMNIVPAIFQEVKMALKDDIRRAIGPFSFTTDMWRGLSSEFMCVTLHWYVTYQEMIQPRCALISIEEFKEAATADNIRLRLEQVFDEWCHEARAMGIMCGVSDNGANIRKGLRDATALGSIHGSVSCFAHNVNLVVRDVMKTQRRIVDGLTVLRRVVSKVKNSMPVRRRFEELQHMYYPDGSHPKLQADVETRWNSCLRMLTTILPQRLAIEALIQDRVMRSHGVELPRCFVHWTDICDTMEQFVKLLEPFNQATLLCSKITSTISSYVPTLKGLMVSVERTAAEGLGSTKDQLLRKLRDMLATHIMSDDNTHVYLASTLLDPRYKKKFVPREKREQVESAVIDTILSLVNNRHITPIAQVAPQDHQDDTDSIDDDQTQEYGDPFDSDSSVHDNAAPNVDDASRSRDVQDASHVHPPPAPITVEIQNTERNVDDESLMAGILAATESESDDDDIIVGHQETLRESASRELQRYLDRPNIDTASSQKAVLEYFKEHGMEFPLISKAALAFQTCPMASVTSERMFSMAGNILTKKRCSLNPENLNKLAIIKMNSQYLH